jgi:NADH:ubiquinone oxidoreductase subunit 2 (subunit N)
MSHDICFLKRVLVVTFEIWCAVISILSSNLGSVYYSRIYFSVTLHDALYYHETTSATRSGMAMCVTNVDCWVGACVVGAKQ